MFASAERNKITAIWCKTVQSSATGRGMDGWIVGLMDCWIDVGAESGQGMGMVGLVWGRVVRASRGKLSAGDSELLLREIQDLLRKSQGDSQPLFAIRVDSCASWAARLCEVGVRAWLGAVFGKVGSGSGKMSSDFD